MIYSAGTSHLKRIGLAISGLKTVALWLSLLFLFLLLLYFFKRYRLFEVAFPGKRICVRLRYFHKMDVHRLPENHLLIKADGSSNMDDPAVRASLQLRHDLERVDKSSEPYENIISQKLNYRQQFFNQEASMVPIPSYMVTEWGGFTPDFTIAWAPWPKENADDPQYRYASADMIAIGKNSAHKEEAYKFLRWMSTEGMLIQNKSIPSWKEVDISEVLTDLVSTTANPEAVDIESLAYVLGYGEESEQFMPAGYMTEVYNAFKAEVDKFLLGEQDLDKTMTNASDAVQKVIDRNK